MQNKERGEILGEIQLFLNGDGKCDRLVFRANRMLNDAIGHGHEKAMKGNDVVWELIEALQEGRRKWDREAMPDLEPWLHSQLRSVVSNIVKREKRFPCHDDFENEDDSCVDANEEALSDDDPVQQYMDEELLDRIRKELEPDPEAGAVFEELTKDNGNQEIADILEIGSQKVVNAKRRIQRRVDKVYRE